MGRTGKVKAWDLKEMEPEWERRSRQGEQDI